MDFDDEAPSSLRKINSLTDRVVAAREPGGGQDATGGGSRAVDGDDAQLSPKFERASSIDRGGTRGDVAGRDHDDKRKSPNQHRPGFSGKSMRSSSFKNFFAGRAANAASATHSPADESRYASSASSSGARSKSGILSKMESAVSMRSVLSPRASNMNQKSSKNFAALNEDGLGTEGTASPCGAPLISPSASVPQEDQQLRQQQQQQQPQQREGRSRARIRVARSKKEHAPSRDRQGAQRQSQNETASHDGEALLSSDADEDVFAHGGADDDVSFRRGRSATKKSPKQGRTGRGHAPSREPKNTQQAAVDGKEPEPSQVVSKAALRSKSPAPVSRKKPATGPSEAAGSSMPASPNLQKPDGAILGEQVVSSGEALDKEYSSYNSQAVVGGAGNQREERPSESPSRKFLGFKTASPARAASRQQAAGAGAPVTAGSTKTSESTCEAETLVAEDVVPDSLMRRFSMRKREVPAKESPTNSAQVGTSGPASTEASTIHASPRRTSLWFRRPKKEK
ncbi:hypothetical protein FVE85_7364 [Porphyridium purpureum]|uniref:Uncharacterized protein n=1 Tax=Porphyridium purpureum TaxID=35688 RepID=A0A5J4Z6Y7_PORPP|nr:hypothetical protein FVE85_7364 [Porphyridium purpureum]|eukprot:POR0469..scf295_1